MRFLKQSTSVDLPIGPFLDETDGKTAETTLTLTQPDIRLKKNGGAWAQKAAAQTLTHEEAGWYEVTLDATDTDTCGQLMLAVHETGALPVWCEFHVVEEAIYDALLAASAAAFDANQDVTVGSIAANAITATAINADAFTAAKFAADVSAEIADAVWDEAQAGHVTAGSFGEVATEVASILVDTAEIGAAGAGLTAINLPDQTMNITGDITGNLSGSVGSVTGAVGSVTGNVGGNVTGSVGSVAAGGIAATSFAAGAIDAAAIAADAIGASELAAGAVDEILDETIGDGTLTMRQALRIMVAALGGKLTGAATTTITIRNNADTADVIVATVDADGNRTNVLVTP